MARYRLTASARADLGSIMRMSEERHGQSARIRYAALLTEAMIQVAEEPAGRSTTSRPELRAGSRSFHFRHARSASREARVVNPVHVIFYRVVRLGLVEIVRVLHERMEPSRHVR